MTKKLLTNIIIGVLLLIILGMAYYIIFSKSSPEVERFDETPYREELARKDSIIAERDTRIEGMKTIILDISGQRDSLAEVKQKVIHHYDKQIEIVRDGTLVQLDSIIRANW